MQALIMSPAGRVFLPLRKDLSRVDESFTSRIGAGDLSGTNNETHTHCTLLAGLRFSKASYLSAGEETLVPSSNSKFQLKIYIYF